MHYRIEMTIDLDATRKLQAENQLAEILHWIDQTYFTVGIAGDLVKANDHGDEIDRIRSFNV